MSLILRTATAAALSVAVAATPAAARPYYGGHHGYYHHYHGGGIGIGGALLGAAIIGGIAYAASDRGPSYGYYDGPPPPPAVYGQAAPPPPVVEGRADPVLDCTRAVEDEASRGGRAHVTGIDRVDRIDGGANVLGYLEIDHGRDAPVEKVGFSCRAAYGEVTGVRIG